MRGLRSALCTWQNLAIPFLSSAKHRVRYTSSPTLVQLQEIRAVLEALRQLPIATPLKRDMLDAALWQVAFATGNTQRKFMGRYRSEAVITKTGLNIQRDHAHRRATLPSELLGPSPDIDSIINRAQCCCIVTNDEHRRLAAVTIDGWERYAGAGIVVYDMWSGCRMEAAESAKAWRTVSIIVIW
jgi:hypothetical protein